MAKLTLTDVANITGAETAAIAAINANNTALETALENTLSRDGTSPNAMSADFDMNGNDILNVGTIEVETDITVGGVSVTAVNIDWTGPWLTATAYAVNDLVSNGGSSYVCIVAHTSGTFATDLAAAKWEVLASKGDTGATGAAGANGVMQTVVAGSGIDVNATDPANPIVSVEANLQEYNAVNPTAAGLALLDDADAAAQLVTLGFTASITELNYTDGVTSAIQTQLDAKQPLDADLTALASNFTAASAAAAASLAFLEDTDNGTNKATITAPAALAADVTITLPSETGTLGVIVDEDTMVSDSATMVPSQQSVKAYVDANAGTVGTLLVPINLGLAASVAGNALTISLKGADGNDPSGTNEVLIPFRNVTPGTGTPSVLTVNSATSLVISSGSTLGFVSATSCRLWVIGVNDAGTFRLGAFTSSDATRIYPLRDSIIMSSTAEGGAGAADSAGVLYTGTAVTSKAIKILGYMEFSLTTAGTWNEVPDVIELFEPGVPLPGQPIQTVFVAAASAGVSTTSTTMVDVTGATASITPTSACNFVRPDMSWIGQNGLLAATNTVAYWDVLRGSTILSGGGVTSRLVIETADGDGNNRTTAGMSFVGYMDKPNSATSTTYKIQHKTSSASASAFTQSVNINLTEIMG